MTTVGDDCHLSLLHADINGGLPYGFILNEPRAGEGRPVSLQRQTDSDGNTTIKVFFNILVADNLVNPDGSTHADSKSAMYSKLIEYLSKTGGITLECAIGVFGNIGATGHSATEMHYDNGASIIACQLNNQGTFWPAADPTRYNLSQWVDLATYTGTMNWGNSYWRAY